MPRLIIPLPPGIAKEEAVQNDGKQPVKVTGVTSAPSQHAIGFSPYNLFNSEFSPPHLTL